MTIVVEALGDLIVIMQRAADSTSEIERRGSERRLTVIDATIICASGQYRAELCDVNSSGVGISWIKDNQAISENTPARIECHHPSFDQQPLLGLIKGCPPDLTYQPNVRSVGLAIDQNCGLLIDQMVQSCVDGIGAPEDASIGLRRAWNVLTHHERVRLEMYFDDLMASESDCHQIAERLMTDPNCPGHRWRNVLGVLFKVITGNTNERATPLEILNEAFAIYKKEFSLNDTERDKPIKWN